MFSYDTIQHIAAILKFENNQTYLKSILGNYHETDWEKLVKIGSHHLVLPPIYCRLKQKELLDILPKDLNNYLTELTQINRNRNNAVFGQVKELSSILRQQNIEHVFLKGMALISANYFEDIGERMIGDIDILVKESQLKEAASLLLRNNYEYKTSTFGEKYFEYHHDLSLISKDGGLAPVELHRHILHSHYDKFLISQNVLENKENYHNIFIPSKYHILENIILNFEINDYGHIYNTIGIRNMYDYICSTNSVSQNILESLFKTSKFHALFIKKTHFYFNNFKIFELKNNHKFIFYLFGIAQKKVFFKSIRNYWAKSRILMNIVSIRVKLLILNVNYRKEVWKDRNRVTKLFLFKLFK
ncbi:MAG: nucleotidyltransferase family protein [Bacteroidetes bacterium]|nr:nucleotidyltransferase family protein [Bacteroidota bacterium]